MREKKDKFAERGKGTSDLFAPSNPVLLNVDLNQNIRQLNKQNFAGETQATKAKRSPQK